LSLWRQDWIHEDNQLQIDKDTFHNTFQLNYPERLGILKKIGLLIEIFSSHEVLWIIKSVPINLPLIILSQSFVGTIMTKKFFNEGQ